MKYKYRTIEQVHQLRANDIVTIPGSKAKWTVVGIEKNRVHCKFGTRQAYVDASELPVYYTDLNHFLDNF